tara:strand:- start:376 stop:957 length:582 start_codon:yes stop_codon:yes gene_type:complete
MIIKFPQNIYFYNQHYSNYDVLREVANFDFDYLKTFGGEVHIWFSTFDAHHIPTICGDLTAKHRPRNQTNWEEKKINWSFFYRKNMDIKNYHDNFKNATKDVREYLVKNYNAESVIDINLPIIKSIRDILIANNVKKYIFYKPLKQSFWRDNGDDWFDTGHHVESLVKCHKLSYLLKGEHWEHEFSAKKVFYD